MVMIMMMVVAVVGMFETMDFLALVNRHNTRRGVFGSNRVCMCDLVVTVLGVVVVVVAMSMRAMRVTVFVRNSL